MNVQKIIYLGARDAARYIMAFVRLWNIITEYRTIIISFTTFPALSVIMVRLQMEGAETLKFASKLSLQSLISARVV